MRKSMKVARTCYKHMQLSLLTLGVYVLVVPFAFSQGENNIWYLTDGLGIDHNSSPPGILSDGALPSFNEGVSSISSSDGELLFYSNGERVWDRTHRVLPNGDSLLGDSASSQSVVFIPIPDSDSIYLFTIRRGDSFGFGLLAYSIIDKSANGGLGDVSTSQKNIVIGDGYIAKLVTVQGVCGDVWILVHKFLTKEIHAFRFNGGQLFPPVISSVLQSDRLLISEKEPFKGTMKASQDGRRIAFAVGRQNSLLEVFSFDNLTGRASNAIAIDEAPSNIKPDGATLRYQNYYNCSFSPNGNYIYTVQQSTADIQKFNLIQIELIDFLSGSPSVDILVIAELNNGGPAPFGLQLSPNTGVIYYLYPGSEHLSIISNPNVKGIAAGFIEEFIDLPRVAGEGMLQNSVVLPNNSKRLTTNILPTDTSLCTASMLTLSPLVSDYESLVWSTMELEDSISIFTPGEFSVILYDNGCPNFDTIQVSSSIIPPPVNDTAICVGDILRLTVMDTNFVSWSTGVSTPSIELTSPGRYWVTYEDNNHCIIIDTFEINGLSGIDGFMFSDTTLCPGDSLHISLSAEADYLWNDGDITPGKILVEEGIYTIEAISLDGCIVFDTLSIEIIDFPILSLGPDLKICSDEVTIINGDVGADSYLWSTGDVTSAISIDRPGVYSLAAITRGCIQMDTITISSNQCDCNIYVPNVFSPQSQISNDLWAPISNCTLGDFGFEIFDRWGNMVYVSDPQSEAWDGTFNGKEVAAGTYVYVVNYSFNDDAQSGQLFGSMTLIR